MQAATEEAVGEEGQGTTVDDGAGEGTGKPQLIPKDLREVFAPATHYLHEWTEWCWDECAEADEVRFGGRAALRIGATHCFGVCFENQLGRSQIEAFAGGQRVCGPLHVEVIAGKLGGLEAHRSFYQALLTDLFRRLAGLPFTVSAPTERGVAESLRPPSPIFALYFLCHHGKALATAIRMVEANPHRELRDRDDRVPFAEVSEVDGDVLLDILRSPDEWRPVRGLPIAKRLHGHAPERVRQRRPEETLDTAENRFVRHFLEQVLQVAERLPSKGWWPNVPDDRQQAVREATGLTRRSLAHSFLAEVGRMARFPAASQVLLRRDGYREMRELWQLFQHARRPLFARLEHAMDVRDIATLYELWVFLRLIGEIAEELDAEPALDIGASEERGIEYRATAGFRQGRELVYNHQFGRGAASSYSVPLRPDCTWFVDGKPTVVFDAKFRLEWADLRAGFEGEDELEQSPRARAKMADIYKMHTYRDALRTVRAAVAVYPGDSTQGDQSVFYDVTEGRQGEVPLRELLEGEREGVGAIARRPKAG